MYSPTMGRFLQTDPVGYADDVNLYAYVKNNPINMTDPSGMIASLSGNFAANATAAPTAAPKLDAPVIAMPASQMGDAIQVAGVVTNPAHYISRVGVDNINSVVGAAIGIALSPGFVAGSEFGMTVNGVNYNVRSFVLQNGNVNLGTIHPDDGRHIGKW